MKQQHVEDEDGNSCLFCRLLILQAAYPTGSGSNSLARLAFRRNQSYLFNTVQIKSHFTNPIKIVFIKLTV